MLPKLNQTRTELSDYRQSLNSRQSNRHTALQNQSYHQRCMSYDDEPSDIARLKKLKEFLCEEDERQNFPYRVVIVKPDYMKELRDKQNLRLEFDFPTAYRQNRQRRRQTARMNLSTLEHPPAAQKQRMKLIQMMEPMQTRFQPKKAQHHIQDRLLASKIL